MQLHEARALADLCHESIIFNFPENICREFWSLPRKPRHHSISVEKACELFFNRESESSPSSRRGDFIARQKRAGLNAYLCYDNQLDTFLAVGLKIVRGRNEELCVAFTIQFCDRMIVIENAELFLRLFSQDIRDIEELYGPMFVFENIVGVVKYDEYGRPWLCLREHNDHRTQINDMSQCESRVVLSNRQMTIIADSMNQLRRRPLNDMLDVCVKISALKRELESCALSSVLYCCPACVMPEMQNVHICTNVDLVAIQNMIQQNIVARRLMARIGMQNEVLDVVEKMLIYMARKVRNYITSGARVMRVYQGGFPARIRAYMPPNVDVEMFDDM